MRLFHWNSQGIDFLVAAESEEAARESIKSNVASWRWQDPERFDAVLKDLESPPYHIAEVGQVVTIDFLTQRG
jgi:hypothetical protein